MTINKDGDLSDILERCQHRLDNPIRNLGQLRNEFMELKHRVVKGNTKIDSFGQSLIDNVVDSFSGIQKEIEAARKNICRDLINNRIRLKRIETKQGG